MVFEPGAMPELFIPGEWDDDDDRYYVPLAPGVGSKPIWISPSRHAHCEAVGVGADYVDTLIR